MGGAAAWKSFRVGTYLTRDELKQLHRRSNLAGALATLTTLGLSGAALVAVAIWPSVPMAIAAVIVIGGRQFAMQVLVHEASHRTLFASRRLNEASGWLFAALYWDDLHRYRETHDRHHRYNASLQDPDVGRF